MLVNLLTPQCTDQWGFEESVSTIMEDVAPTAEAVNIMPEPGHTDVSDLGLSGSATPAALVDASSAVDVQEDTNMAVAVEDHTNAPVADSSEAMVVEPQLQEAVAVAGEFDWPLRISVPQILSCVPIAQSCCQTLCSASCT